MPAAQQPEKRPNCDAGKAAGELENQERLGTANTPRLLCPTRTKTNAEHHLRVQAFLGVEQQLPAVWQKPRANLEGWIAVWALGVSADPTNGM